MGNKFTMEGEWGPLLSFLAVLIIILFAVGISTCHDPKHLGNDKIYDCPKGDWSGYTKDMMMVSDGDGRRNYYCPIDGAWIGWENDIDPLPIGGNAT